MTPPFPHISLEFEVSDGARVRHERKSVILKGPGKFSEFNAIGSFPCIGNEMAARRHMAKILRGLADEMENEKISFLPKTFWRDRAKPSKGSHP